MSQIKFICLKESFYREKKKMSQIKIHQVLPQGELSQRKERI